MGTPKICPVKTSNKTGFTLLEVLIVLGILASIVAFGIPKLRTGENIKTVVRKMTSLSREIRNKARMKRMTYRWVFRLEEGHDAYWVESASGNVLIPSDATLENIQSMDEKERPANPFQKATNFFKEENGLPSGVSLVSVETASSKQPITKGLAYIYFSPEGLVEHSVVQVGTKTPATWSLIFNPLTGHADIVEKPISLKDVKVE